MRWSLPIFALVAVSSSLVAAEPGARPATAPLVKVPEVQRIFDKAKSPKIVARFENPIELPASTEAEKQIDLELTTATFDNPGVNEVDPTIPRKFELITYNGKRTGPTIRVNRGEALVIRIHNHLQDSGDVDPGPVEELNETGEKPHGLSTTNLHTHGLHVSPDGNSDNVFQSIEPGETFTYRYKIPDNHPAGTFWYHPHKHGSVAYQLSNGLAGALIVEGSHENPNDLESIPEIDAASRDGHEQIVLLQLFTFRKGIDRIGRIDAKQIYNIYRASDPPSSASIKMSGDPPYIGNLQATAINGRINPVFHIAPGEVQRWRIVHAGADLLRNLIWVDSSDTPTELIRFNEIAIDGLATGTMTPYSSTCPLQLAPGQRSDVLIEGPTVPDGTVFYLKENATAKKIATHGRATDPYWLAKLEVRGPAQHMSIPDIKNPVVADSFKKRRAFPSIQDGELTHPNPTQQLTFLADDANDIYTINNKTFHQQPPITLYRDDAEEWTISADSGQDGGHPFHIHVNPFEVVKHNGILLPPEQRQWRDTLYVTPGESYGIRMKFKDFLGDSVFHCHILDHEDQGMMACLQFRDKNDPNAVIAGPGCPSQTLRSVNITAPALNLVASDGKRELYDPHGRTTMLVFFRGLSCPHCVSKLRELVAMLRVPEASGFEVIAISSEAIGDATNARKVLGIDSNEVQRETAYQKA